MPLTRAGRNFLAAWTIEEAGTVPFNHLYGHLGIGSVGTTFDQGQTDLAAVAVSALWLRKQMDIGYPVRFGPNNVIARSLLLGGEAQFAITEWGWFNAPLGGVMMTRKAEVVGTKPVGTVWSLTATFVYGIG